MKDCKRIKTKVDQMKRDIRANLQETLRKIGEDAIAEARLNGNYNNLSGNLRNSIGYAVISDGTMTRGRSNGTSSPVSVNGTDKEKSESGYKSHIEALKSDGDGEMQLIVVAGMEYAPFVEQNGRNVLQSAKTMVERETPKEMEDLKNLIIEKFNN